MAKTQATREYDVPGRDERLAISGWPSMQLRHYGDEQGLPVLMLHGTPGSRFKFSMTDQSAQQLALHVIAPDRWSYGGTDAPETPTLVGFANWVGGAMSVLGYRHFAVCGISGGGPYATAVAAALPGRVTATALISPVGLVAEATAAGEVDLFHRFCFGPLAASPRAVAAIFSAYALSVRHFPSLAARLTVLRAPPPDHAVMNDPQTRVRLLRTFAEGLRRTARGPAIDLALFRQLATLDLSGAVAPTRIWIGTRDTNVPVKAVARLANRLPNASLTVLEGEGHLWAAHHYGEVLGWIASVTRRPSPASV